MRVSRQITVIFANADNGATGQQDQAHIAFPTVRAFDVRLRGSGHHSTK